MVQNYNLSISICCENHDYDIIVLFFILVKRAPLLRLLQANDVTSMCRPLRRVPNPPLLVYIPIVATSLSKEDLF